MGEYGVQIIKGADLVPAMLSEGFEGSYDGGGVHLIVEHRLEEIHDEVGLEVRLFGRR